MVYQLPVYVMNLSHTWNKNDQSLKNNPSQGNAEAAIYIKRLKNAFKQHILKKKDWKTKLYQFLLKYRATPIWSHPHQTSSHTISIREI